ncbi:related to triose phosphate/3-phosphoglycerate/phosphate translocator [Cephalotrichum gorgonifer]|uniref:Related to triose phosphate/3-phosphoglycerate/phosphate translocator n=1 Tax=Cephalotrichum gorgonifer TaxID=2041049 RepID=A0AAE8SXF2_9PEZI|nr:related to triose phosphate/3-phosphoglycerate/phosphate translocator [Cephalotrichum gorgonifer]
MTEKARLSGDSPSPLGRNSPILPTTNPNLDSRYLPKAKSQVPASLYIVSWISISSAIILFNKWILDDRKFHYPILLTTYHLTLATVLTQAMARWTKVLDGRHKLRMTPQVYARAIVPIGVTFSLSLICGNLTYLYLSVAFIQMLKATTPVAVLLSGWLLGVSRPDLKVFINVSGIVVGVILASMGEVNFVLIGVLFQIGGVLFEALRLTLVQKLLTSEYKMDPLLSIYYYAPVCAVFNFGVALVFEVPSVTMEQIYHVGLPIFFVNGMIAFLLNFAAVSLIGKTSAVVLTLCGVLKDILLVVASILIWGTPISLLQVFGYSIALSGIVYYKLGYTAVRNLISDAGRQWSRRSGLRKAVLVGVIFLGLCFWLRGPGTPASPLDQDVPFTGNSNKRIMEDALEVGP